MHAEQWKPSPRPSRRQLKSTTVLPVMLGIGVAGAGLGLGLCSLRPAGAASGVVAAANPEAMPRDIRLVACNPCNPCAAAGPCGPCNPCAASTIADPCSPCAAANPCNPCAAGAGATTECTVPRLQTAAASPCNPSAAAKPCSPCNPCAAANPCNPCAAANPCNPCAAANPCNPCAAANPCTPGAVVELTDAEAAEVYDCVKDAMQAAYGGAEDPAAGEFLSWTSYSLLPYRSATHGNRYVMNYANAAGEAYGRYEEVGTLPPGAKLAKNSFTVGADGRAVVGPLFLMEKMAAGFDEDTGNWRYTMIMPDGSTFGVTNGENSAGVEFCNACHAVVGAEQDYLYFMPEDYRVTNR